MAKLTSSQMYRPGRKWTSRSALETRRFCSNDRGEKIGTRFTACTRVSRKKSEGGGRPCAYFRGCKFFALR